MKPPSQWTEEDLRALPLGEFDWLEAKGRKALDLTVTGVNEKHVRENLSKAVSAFANSGGGVLVLGVQDPKDGWKVDDGGVSLSIRGRTTREWLEDVVPQLVQHPLQRLNVYAIVANGEGSEIGPDRGVFLIEVPDSQIAPHQATDLRYYARVGGKSHPIGHRFVSDIFNRPRHPSIDVSVARECSEWVQEKDRWGNPTGKSTRSSKLRIRATNTGRALAQFVHVFVCFPAKWLPDDEDSTLDGVVEYRFRNTRQDVMGGSFSGNMTYRPTYGPSWFDPMLPGISQSWTINMHDDVEHQLPDGKVEWTAYADSAPATNGSVSGVELIPVKA